jgi:elongation of very long chain fatty acids protein 4
MHSWRVPLFGTIGYLATLPVLKVLAQAQPYDAKALLKESMFVYNAAQVVLNGLMVWMTVVLLWGGKLPLLWNNSVPYAAPMLWLHYCDKYLEFLDTAFMVLRGRYDQVLISRTRVPRSHVIGIFQWFQCLTRMWL